MSLIKVDFKCPKCGKKLRVKLYREVDETKIPDIISRDLFKVKCECGEEVTLNYSLVLYAENYLIYFKANDDKVEIKEHKGIKRICTEFNYLFKPIISDNNLPFFNSLMIWLSLTFTLKVATMVSWKSSLGITTTPF